MILGYIYMQIALVMYYIAVFNANCRFFEGSRTLEVNHKTRMLFFLLKWLLDEKRRKGFKNILLCTRNVEVIYSIKKHSRTNKVNGEEIFIFVA